jgi:very-short-patch-repair endonuclease
VPASPRKLARIAARQHGVFSRAQALSCGFSARTVVRRVQSGAWQRIRHGVYRVGGAPATWHQALMAACLACAPSAVVSHRAAAALWRLAGFEPRLLELSVRPAIRRARGCIVHWPPTLDADDVTVVDGIPVTTVQRTLLDLAGCVPANVLEEALDDALRRRLVRVASLQVVPRAGRRGARLLGRMIDERAGMKRYPESPIETRLLRILRAAGMRAPEVQRRIGRYRVDAAYVRERVAIEADSFRWHSSARRWDADRAKDAALSMMGWEIVRVTSVQLNERPDEVTAIVRAALGRRRP